MEVAIDFNTFCNICFNKQSLRKVEETDHLTNILMIFIEYKIMVHEQEIYLCLNCCEILESYDRFKEMCLKNFIDFRVEYFELKNKLEIMNDRNVEHKLKIFVETKVYGASHTLNLDASEDFLKAGYNVIPVPISDMNLTEKQGEEKGNHLHSINFKTERVEYEDSKEYKFHSEVNLESSGKDLKMPVHNEHVKVESYVEDTGATESSIEQSKSTEPCKTYDTTTKLMEDKISVSSKRLNKNSESANKKISGIMCNICRKTFSTNSNLNKHMRIHTGVNPYECPLCHVRFAQLITYKIHRLTHTGEKPHTCSVCKKAFRHLSSLRNHERLHTGVKPFTCTICNKSFTKSRSLKKHAAVHTYSCNVCNKTYAKLRHLKEHEWIHTGKWPHICNICNKGFSQSSVLKRHMVIHTDENPYTCRICQKSFSNISHLTRHMRVHSGEKPYECSECNKRFADRRTYKVHMLRHTGERPHSCSVCKKAFRQLSTLRRHERTHTTNKKISSVECKICRKTFFDASNLNKHMRIHTGEKPYTCTICNKSFTQSNSLKRHTAIHIGKKRCS